MSEKINSSPEHHAEHIDTSAESKKALEQLLEKSENAHESTVAEVQVLEKNAENQAISGKEITIGEKEKTNSSTIVTKDLKMKAYQKSLKQVRQSLPVTDRTFSKLIHQKFVENISTISSVTVARSSGFLGGSFIALAGSIIFLFISKRYGFGYNYTIFFFLFAGGYFIGLFAELLLRAIKKRPVA